MTAEMHYIEYGIFGQSVRKREKEGRKEGKYLASIWSSEALIIGS